MRPLGFCCTQIYFVYEFYLEKFSKSWCVSSQSWTQSKRSVPLFSGALWRATLDAQTMYEDEIWRNWMAKTRGCISEKKGWELFSTFGSCGTKDDAGRQSCQKLIGEGSWPKITHAKYFTINIKWKTSFVTSRALCIDLFDISENAVVYREVDIDNYLRMMPTDKFCILVFLMSSYKLNHSPFMQCYLVPFAMIFEHEFDAY